MPSFTEFLARAQPRMSMQLMVRPDQTVVITGGAAAGQEDQRGEASVARERINQDASSTPRGPARGRSTSIGTQKAEQELRDNGPKDLDDLASAELRRASSQEAASGGQVVVDQPRAGTPRSGEPRERGLERAIGEPGAESEPGGSPRNKAADSGAEGISAPKLPGVSDEKPASAGSESSSPKRHGAAPSQSSTELTGEVPVAAGAEGASAASISNELSDGGSLRAEARPAGAIGATVGRMPTSKEALLRLANAAPARAQLVEQPEPVSQVQGALAEALTKGDGTVSLRLRPDSLGQVTINLVVQGTSVSARLDANTESARRLLSESVAQLREALEARGLRVERIEIPSAAEPSSAAGVRDGAPDVLPGRVAHEAKDDGSRPPTEWAGSDHQQGGAESHAQRRHAGSDGRRDASGAGGEGDDGLVAAEPRANPGGWSLLSREPGGPVILRFDALA